MVDRRVKGSSDGPPGRPRDAGAVALPLFVYGTLMPGHLRWPVIEPHALGWRPTAVEGRIYDTGRGWPAAVFEPGEPLVRGWAIDLVAEVAPTVLAHLDEVEGVAHGLFRRVEVALLGGEPAVAYEWAGALDDLVPITDWDDERER